MKIEIQTDESEDGPHKLAKPVEFNSKGQRTRLLVLVSSLMLVLIGMNEARKPENWAWMGFDRNGKQLKLSEKSDKSQIVVRESQYDTPDESLPSNTGSTGDLPSLDQNESSDVSDLEAIESTEGPKKTESDAPESDATFPAENVLAAANRRQPSAELFQPKFWVVIYGQLSVPERRLLFRTTRKLRNERENDPAEFEERGKLVQKIGRFVQLQSEELLSKLALLETGSPKRVELDSQLQGLQKQWESIAAALNSDELLNQTQLADILALQTILDVAALNDIEDRTHSGRPSDDMAWLRIWETIFDPEFAEQQFLKVTPFQLKAQSQTYRAKPVSLTGELRGIHVVKTKRNPLGIDVFYNVWVKPESSSIFPFNAYVTELPEGIELEKDKLFTEFKNENVQIDGVFFKVRTYKDNGKTISVTPWVLSRSFKMTGKTTVESLPVHSSFQISKSQWIAFLIGMPLLAGVLAYLAYRGTLNRRSHPGRTVTDRINNSLEELTSDPGVQTVEEKLANLNRDEL